MHSIIVIASLTRIKSTHYFKPCFSWNIDLVINYPKDVTCELTAKKRDHPIDVT